MEAAAPPRQTAPAPSGRPITLVIALTLVYAYAFMDRVILGLLVEPIKADLHLTDTQIGLLLGLAFAVLYSLANLPAGALADRYDRRALIGAASLGWVAMTLVCALADGFGQLFLGRAGVGLAEAMIGPCAFSLIRDGVPEPSRGTAFSVYAMSPLIGAGAALLGGGALLHAARTGVLAGFGLPASWAAWRVALGTVGALGLPLTLLLFTFPEPPRGGARPGGSPGAPAATREALAHLRQNIAIYVPLVCYVAFGGMMSFGQSSWLPAMLGRRWSIPPERIGPMLGGVTLVCGLLGLVLTGVLLKRMTVSRRDIRVYGAWAACGSAVGLAAAAIAPSLRTSLACVGVGLFFVGASYPIGAATLSQIAPVRLMGRIAAGYLVFPTLLGQALGPMLVALLARLFAGRAALPFGFATAMILFGASCALSAVLLRRTLARGVAAATLGTTLAVAGGPR